MPDSAPPPAPLNRSARTRQALIEAGRRLFSIRPVDAVAIDDIVQAARVAKGSFYNHFKDKDALVRAITGQIRRDIEDAVAAANANVSDPALRTVRGLCVYLGFAAQQPEHAVALLRIQGGHTSLNAPLNRGIVEDIASGRDGGRFSLPSVEVGVLMVMGVAQIALAKITEAGPDLNPSHLAQQLCTVLLRGFGLDPDEAQTLADQAALLVSTIRS